MNSQLWNTKNVDQDRIASSPFVMNLTPTLTEEQYAHLVGLLRSGNSPTVYHGTWGYCIFMGIERECGSGNAFNIALGTNTGRKSMFVRVVR